MNVSPDSVDLHVARWAALWEGNPAFDPEVEGAITRMQSLMRRLRRVEAAAFADSELSSEDVKTLHSLMVQPYPGEATPTQLAEASGVTKAAMTGRLDRLEKAGLVTRQTDDANRRRVLVQPTREGRRIWESQVHEGMKREQELLGALSAQELTQLNSLLRKAVRNLE